MPGARPPVGPNSFIFANIFGKKHPHQRSTLPPNGPRPPTGNPGSATVMVSNFPEELSENDELREYELSRSDCSMKLKAVRPWDYL